MKDKRDTTRTVKVMTKAELLRRAIEIKAAKHSAKTAVEREALQAVYAYEQVLQDKHGRNIRAGRTWPMIEKRGIIPAVEHIVTKRDVSTGYTTLVEMGMQDMAF